MEQKEKESDNIELRSEKVRNVICDCLFVVVHIPI